MNQGNITYTGVQGNPPAAVLGANNGLSVDALSSFVVLGQNVGAVGNPAFMLSNREIPYTAAQLIFTNLLAAGSDLRVGNVSAGRTTLKINGLAGGVATIWMTHSGATTYRDWQWEATTADTGRLVLNDNVGNFFIMNRNLASMSAPLHVYHNVLDNAINFAIALNTTRPRYVLTNRGAAGNIIITLPAVGTLRWPEFTFTSVNGFLITIQAPAGVTIRIGAIVSAAGGTVTNTGIGDSVRLQALSLTEWQATAMVGAWVTP